MNQNVDILCRPGYDAQQTERSPSNDDPVEPESPVAKKQVESLDSFYRPHGISITDTNLTASSILRKTGMKDSVRQDMASVAASVAGPLFQENRLNRGFERLEIESVPCREICIRSGRSLDGQANPFGEICHSGSLRDRRNLPPVCIGSAPASGARGCRSRGLQEGSPGVTSCRTNSKFLWDCSSLQEELPEENGSRRSRVARAE